MGKKLIIRRDSDRGILFLRNTKQSANQVFAAWTDEIEKATEYDEAAAEFEVNRRKKIWPHSTVSHVPTDYFRGIVEGKKFGF